MTRWPLPTSKRPQPRRTARRSAVVACVAATFVVAGCNLVPAAQRCVRHELGSMGLENGYRIDVPADAGWTLDDDVDRLNVAFTIVPPIGGPVTLIHMADGKVVERWDLKVGAPSGVSARCGLGYPPSAATCGAVITVKPHALAGQWQLESNANHVLEAGLSARLCR